MFCNDKLIGIDWLNKICFTVNKLKLSVPNPQTIADCMSWHLCTNKNDCDKLKHLHYIVFIEIRQHQSGQKQNTLHQCISTLQRPESNALARLQMTFGAFREEDCKQFMRLINRTTEKHSFTIRSLGFSAGLENGTISQK